MVTNQSREVAVVDDDVAVLDSFRFMLELAGFQASIYPSATAYLERADIRPRCLILDQHMPAMTGLQLAARLRADGRDVPIMLITSSLSPGIIARAAEIGVEQVIEKPPAEADVIGFVMRY